MMEAYYDLVIEEAVAGQQHFRTVVVVMVAEKYRL